MIRPQTTASEPYRKAEQARYLLENDLFREVLRSIDSEIVVKWRDESDPDERTVLFFRQKALREIQDDLLKMVEKAADHDAREGIEGSAWREIYNTLKDME